MTDTRDSANTLTTIEVWLCTIGILLMFGAGVVFTIYSAYHVLGVLVIPAGLAFVIGVICCIIAYVACGQSVRIVGRRRR